MIEPNQGLGFGWKWSGEGVRKLRCVSNVQNLHGDVLNFKPMSHHVFFQHIILWFATFCWFEMPRGGHEGMLQIKEVIRQKLEALHLNKDAGCVTSSHWYRFIPLLFEQADGLLTEDGKKVPSRGRSASSQAQPCAFTSEQELKFIYIIINSWQHHLILRWLQIN